MTFPGHLNMSHEAIHTQNRAKTMLKDEQQTISHTIIEFACAQHYDYEMSKVELGLPDQAVNMWGGRSCL